MKAKITNKTMVLFCFFFNVQLRLQVIVQIHLKFQISFFFTPLINVNAANHFLLPTHPSVSTHAGSEAVALTRPGVQGQTEGEDRFNAGGWA